MLKHRKILPLALGASLLGIAAAVAQLPDEGPPTPGFPAPSGASAPGNLDLNRIDRAAPAFPDAPPMRSAPAARAAPAPGGRGFAPPPIFVGGRTMPGYGYIHEFGAFQVMNTTAEGMFMLSSVLPFPDGRRSVDFYRATLRYVGRYGEPGTNISGYVYETDIGPPVNDRRYILFGDRDLRVNDPNSNGVRWMVYYDGDGRRTYYTTARFYRP